jgi:TonB family protein
MRSTSSTIPLLFSIALGCGSAETQVESGSPAKASDEPAPPAEPALPQPPVGAFVVLDQAATLATAPSADAARIPIVGEKTLDVGRIAEVVGVVGDFIEVRTVPPERGPACSGRLGGEADIELRFFVERSALLQVLTAPKRAEFDDGTKLEFAAGVPVIEVGENGQLAAGEARLFMPLTAEDVGLWFTALPSGTFQEQPEGPGSGVFHYGERKLDAVPPFMLSDSVEEIDGGRRMTFVNACGSFTFRIDFAEAPPREVIDAKIAEREAKIRAMIAADAGKDPLDCELQQWVAAAGTSASWKQSGTPAGTTLREYAVPEGAVESEGKVCFSASGFDLCFESSKLTRRDNLECLGAGGLGLVGIGGESGDAPTGAGFGGKGKAVPLVKQAKATVSAGLSADIIRRIVRAHINEVRTCYDKGLAASPTLAGTIEIAFTIDAGGKVPSASVKQSTLAPANDMLGACIVKAVQTWTFPKPDGGAKVDVVYPFILEAG